VGFDQLSEGESHLNTNKSPENLRKFLESDDQALIVMGLSMAKGTNLPEELHGLVLKQKLWNQDSVVRQKATQALKKHAPKILEKTKHLRSTFKVNDLNKLKYIILELKKLGFTESYPLEQLKEKFKNTRHAEGILNILENINSYEVAELLIEGICTARNRYVAANIGKSLAKIEYKSKVDKLISAFEKEHSSSANNFHQKRNNIICAMPNVTSDAEKFVEPLINFLKEDFIHLLDEDGLEIIASRYNATLLLGEIGDSRSAELLIDIIKNEPDRFLDRNRGNESYYNNDARRGAIIALGEMKQTQASSHIAELLAQFCLELPSGNFRHSYFNVLVSEADKYLYQRFQELNSAVISLGKIGNRNSSKILLDLLKKLVEYDFGKNRIINLGNSEWGGNKNTHDIELICSIAYSLSKIQAGFESLVNLLEHNSDTIRFHTIRALAKNGDKRSIQPLFKALEKSNENVKISNIYTLSIGTESHSNDYEEWWDEKQDQIDLGNGIFPASATDMGSSVETNLQYCFKSIIIKALRSLNTNIPVNSLRIEDLLVLLEENNSEAATQLSEKFTDKNYNNFPRIRSKIATALKNRGWSPPTENLEIQYLIALSEWSDLVKFRKEASKKLINFLEAEEIEQYSSIWTNAVNAHPYSETIYQVSGYAYDSSDRVYSAVSSEGHLNNVWDPNAKCSERKDVFIKKLFPFGVLAKIGDKESIEYLENIFHAKELCNCKYGHNSCKRMAAGIALGFTDGMPSEKFYELCTEVDKQIQKTTLKWKFKSSSQPGVTYFVILDSAKNPICDCPGFEYRRQCRHIEEVKKIQADPGDSGVDDIVSKLDELDGELQLNEIIDDYGTNNNEDDLLKILTNYGKNESEELWLRMGKTMDMEGLSKATIKAKSIFELGKLKSNKSVKELLNILEKIKLALLSYENRREDRAVGKGSVAINKERAEASQLIRDNVKKEYLFGHSRIPHGISMGGEQLIICIVAHALGRIGNKKALDSLISLHLETVTTASDWMFDKDDLQIYIGSSAKCICNYVTQAYIRSAIKKLDSSRLVSLDSKMKENYKKLGGEMTFKEFRKFNDFKSSADQSIGLSDVGPTE